jgi:hypothetical protein
LKYYSYFVPAEFAYIRIFVCLIDPIVVDYCIEIKIQRLPLVGLSIVPIRLRKVVFPPPDGPRMIANSPLFMAPSYEGPFKVIFFKATTLYPSS